MNMSRIIFSKSSYDRLMEFQTKTRILSDSGHLSVEKQALSVNAASHISSLPEKYRILQNLYSGKLRPIPCELHDNNIVVFPFIEGRTMTDLLIDCFAGKRNEEAIDLISDFYKQIREIGLSDKFIKCDEFIKVFGDIDLPGDLTVINPANIDIVFDNIIVSPTGEYNVIDYEWTFTFPIPIKFVMYRSLLHSCAVSQAEKDVKERIYNLLDANEAVLSSFYNMEINFQQYVYGSKRKMEDYFSKFGNPSFYIGQPSQMEKINNIRNAYETEASEREKAQERAKELYAAYSEESKLRESAEKQVQEYRDAYSEESKLRESAERQAQEYREAYSKESKLRESAERQAQEYRVAYSTESELRESAEKRAQEYRDAYSEESKLRESAEKQAQEYHDAYSKESELRESAEKKAEEYYAAYKTEAELREQLEKRGRRRK